MSKERYLSPYSEDERAAIAQILRPADEARNDDMFRQLLFGIIREQFGRLNFADLEVIFRENGFTACLSAVPVELLKPLFPAFICVDPNDLETQLSYVAILHVGGIEQLQKTAQQLDFHYDPFTNLEHLTQAGVFIPRPGSDFARMAKADLN